MSDLTSAATPEVQTEATSMGWIPPEKFKGDPEKFVDADEYVEKGKQVLPILRANNAKLHGDVNKLTGETQSLRTMLANAQESIEALKNFQSEETKRQVKEAKSQVLRELVAAKKDGDVELEVELTEALSELNAATKTPPVEKKEEHKSITTPPPHPDFLAWAHENPWFGTDTRKTALTNAIAQELRADPKNNGLVGRAFFDKCSEEADITLGKKPSRPASKVEGSGGGSSGGGSSGGSGRGYRDLPADAKEACTRQAEKLVGTGKAFKDMAGWQAHYAKIYFQGEE